MLEEEESRKKCRLLLNNRSSLTSVNWEVAVVIKSFK